MRFRLLYIKLHILYSTLFLLCPFFAVRLSGWSRRGFRLFLWPGVLHRGLRDIQQNGTFASAIISVIPHIRDHHTIFNGPYFGRQAINKVAIMRDKEERALKIGKDLLKELARLQVEVIGRL